MQIFSKTPKATAPTTVKVELSQETRDALMRIESDILTLHSFVGEVAQTLSALRQQILVEAQVEAQGCGVEPFDSIPDDFPILGDSIPFPFKEISSVNPQVRATPFSRTPRPEQIDWLKKVAADGKWHTAKSLSTAYASDSREARYLTHAIGARLREMWEEGQADRRSSAVAGSMVEYRIKS